MCERLKMVKRGPMVVLLISDLPERGAVHGAKLEKLFEGYVRYEDESGIYQGHVTLQRNLPELPAAQ